MQQVILSLFFFFFLISLVGTEDIPLHKSPTYDSDITCVLKHKFMPASMLQAQTIQRKIHPCVSADCGIIMYDQVKE